MPSDSEYDPAVHLGKQDLAVDNPKLIRVQIKQSKTDPFRKGVDLFLGRTSSDLCPVTALLRYLVVGVQRRALFSCFQMVRS